MDEIVAVFGIQDPQAPHDVEQIAQKHKKYESMRRMIFSLVSSKGGRPVGQIHGNEIVSLPVDQAEVIKEIHQRLGDDLACRCSIGVGEDSHEALLALEHAQKNSPGSIKVFHRDMDDEGDGEDMIKPQSVAVGPDDEPITKSEKYVPISPEEKTQIAQILKQVQANANTFAQIREQQPDIYAGLVSVVQSLTMMLAQDKKDQDAHVEKMVNKINQHLQRQEQKKQEKQAKEIDKEIGKESKEHIRRRTEDRQRLIDAAAQHRVHMLDDAKSHAEAHGHSNPKFFFNLLRAFK